MISQFGFDKMLGMQVRKWQDNFYNAEITLTTILGKRQVNIKEKDKKKYDKAIIKAFNELLI